MKAVPLTAALSGAELKAVPWTAPLSKAALNVALKRKEVELSLSGAESKVWEWGVTSKG